MLFEINVCSANAAAGMQLDCKESPQRQFHSIHCKNPGDSMIYAAPGQTGAKIAYKAKYDNFIGGKYVAPLKGEYFDVITPISGKVYTQAARSGAEDIELALDAAHAAADAWGKTSVTERSNIAQNCRPN
jgi:hypothetical protein